MTCLGHGLYEPQGHRWQHLKRRTLVYTAYESSGTYGFREEAFLCFSQDPPFRVCMDPRGTFGRICSRIYKEDHFRMLQTKYESFGTCGFGEEDFFKVFPMTPPGARLAGFIKRTTIHCYRQNMKALGLVVSEKIFYVLPMTQPGRGRMDPRGTAGRIYKEDHYMLLHIKYESFRTQRRRFFKVFPMRPPEQGPYGPQGYGWHDL